MYDNIVVPLALDHGFAPTAMQVARKLLNPGGKITALHVYEAPQGTASAFIDDASVTRAFEAAKKRLDERVAGQSDVIAVVHQGHSGRAIIDYATDNLADCIVMGSHKPGLIDYLLGATAARVVRHAPCAVHVLRSPT
jgi:nucleotide-binding universal stress UspA family protein